MADINNYVTSTHLNQKSVIFKVFDKKRCDFISDLSLINFNGYIDKGDQKTFLLPFNTDDFKILFPYQVTSDDSRFLYEGDIVYVIHKDENEIEKDVKVYYIIKDRWMVRISEFPEYAITYKDRDYKIDFLVDDYYMDGVVYVKTFYDYYKTKMFLNPNKFKYSNDIVDLKTDYGLEL